MAETDIENTDPNPFLEALKAYKKTNGAPPVQPQRTGSVNPFADLVVKKKSEISASGAQNGLHQSPNGSASSQSSPDNSLDNTPGFRKPNIVPTSTDVGVPFDRAHKIIADMPNEGSYSNLPQHLANKLTSTVSNGLAGLAGMVRNQTPNGNLPLYDKDGNISDYGQSVDHDASTDPIGRFILTLNGATKAENQQNTANPLPQTVMGKITGGTIDVAPDIAATALMPEAEAPEALSALSKLKSAIWNPFTKVLTGKGFVNSVNEGAQRGETPDEQLKSGAIGAGNGFVNGGTMGLLGGIAGGISEPIFKGMDKIGLVSAGNSALTKAGVKAVADANLFAALPLVTAGGEHIYNRLIGAKDDPNLWKNAKEEAQTGFGMGLGFGAMDVFHALGEDAHSKAQIAEVHNDRQAVALQNFVTADPEAITQAFKNPTPTGDLNAQAVEYAHKAMQENDADKKQQLILVAQTLAKSSDVKGVTQAILSDKNGFLAHINQSDIPDAMKKQITDKVNLIHSQLDPAEQQKQALGQKINSIDQDIAKIQPQADNEPDIVKKTDAEVGIENLNKTRDEFIKELKGITVKQHEDMQKNSAPVDYTPVELPENKEPFMNHEQQDNSEQNNNSPLNISENESTKSSEEAKQESSPQRSTENALPTQKEVVNPDGDKKPSDTTKPLDIEDHLKEVYKENPELSKIGSEGEYKAHLNNIFPDSKMKDIVYHGSKSKTIEDFNKELLHTGEGYHGFGEGFYFGVNKDLIDKEYSKGGKTYSVVLNIKKNLGWLSKADDNLVANLKNKYPDLKIDKTDTNGDIYEKLTQYLYNYKYDTDEFSTNKFGYKPASKTNEVLKSLGYDSITNENSLDNKGQFIMFEPDQIHILGSKKDIKKFKENTASGTNDPLKQKAIDAITHGIIGDGERKEGDTSPRFDLDMPTVEQERAIRHIIKGKYDSVAAKKMIDKVMEWEAKNQYPIIEGLGGGSIRTRDATSEEIQNHIDDAKANKIGELSPRQVEEHNQAAKELGITPEDAKRYEEYQQSGIGTKAGTPEISARPVQQSENDTATGTTQDKGDKAPQGGNEPTTGEPAGHKSEPTDGGSAEPVKPKVKIDKYELIQPSHLKGTDYHLALGEFHDGKFGIIDTQTKNRISNLYDSKWEAINTYEKNREKLTPKVVDDYIAKTKKIEFPDEAPKAKIVPLSEKGKTAIDKDIEPHGITYDQIKAYEQARSKPDAGLPDSDTKEPRSVQEDVRPTDDKSGSTDKNTEGEGVREQPEKSASAIKEEKIRKKIEDNKKEFMKAVRETRKKGYSNPLDPELIAKGVKLMASYAELGIHKFSEIAKDFISILGKDNFTDDDADALKAAYFAHVANLNPKERKPFDSLKDVDTFMGDGMKLLRGQEPKASLPERTIPAKERLPVEQPEKTEKDAKENYKWLGKFKDNRVRNLEQLKQFAKDVGNFDPLREVRKFATSKSQASVILKTATQKIIGLVGKDGWQNLREALVESRLRGVKQRWNNFAEDIANKTDSETKEYFADGKTGQMYDLLDNLKGISEENPASFASSLIAAGRYDDARKYLSDVFKQTADNTLTLGKLSNGKTFDEQVQDGEFTDPKMQKALQAYKDFIEKPIAESHESNDGIFSDALGDLETYYPLTPTAQQDKHFIAGAKPYKAPLNPNNRFATGQSDNYSREIADLSDNLAKSIKTNNKANAIESLKKAGLIVDIPHNEKETGTITLNGETYKAVKVKVAEGRTIIENGQIFNTQSKYVAMPVWLDRELKPIFDANSDYDKYSALGDTLNSLVKYQLGGPIEATAHSMRLLGGITNSMPFMQEWAYKNGVLGKAGGIVANNPIVKTFVGMGKILFTDLKSDKALQTIQEMAKNGDIPEKTWTKTWSREFAELTGAKASRIKIGKLDIPNITDFSPILYGKRSLDLKARVTMYNLTKAMNPDATPEMHTKMQQQLGVYTKSLQSNLERFVKHHGIAPFYSFGSAIYREGIKAVVGASALPLERPTLREALTTGIGAKQAAKLSGYKAAQLLSTGILGTTAYWMATYHAQTGMWPWEDPKSKLLRNPFPEFAKNDFTEKYFKNKKTGEWDDIDFAAYANPYLNRGLRAFGAPKIWETNQLGGTGSQTAEAGFLQALNTSISPYTSSPAFQLALNQVSGSAPYITNNRDDKGKPSMGLYRKVRTMPTFLQQQAANAEVGFQSLNPVANFIGSEATNMMGIKSFQSHADEDDASVMSSFKFAFGIAFPRIITPHGDDDKKASFIQKEADATAKEADKEAE